MQLINFDPASFLRDAWQKKPLLIRNPWAAWQNPLSPDELAGLACEEDVESRLITQESGMMAAEDGPLPEDRFGKLGKAPWTLLVQAVDHYVPAVAELIEPFRFIPNWRIDDVMVSYAADGGGVGAHFDQYDVFLIQGLGRRRWQVGGYCDEKSALLPHDDLRLLADFVPTDEWLLEPGDILYVPPGFAHNGVAEGDDCMTYSVGFRAPSQGELMGDYCDHLIETLADDDRYADPDLKVQCNPGEISPAAIAALHAMVIERLRDEGAFALWFGQYNSTPKYPEMDWSPEAPLDDGEIAAFIRDGMPLSRNPASRFSFIRRIKEQQGGDLTLFADGKAFACEGDTARFAETLCAGGGLIAHPGLLDSPSGVALIAALLAQGSLVFEDDAD